MRRHKTRNSHFYRTTEPANAREMHLAVWALVISAAFFTAAVPFAKLPLAHVEAFIAVQQTALIVCDLITALLLINQFRVLPSRALLILASGYFFSALMAAANGLTYPISFHRPACWAPARKARPRSTTCGMAAFRCSSSPMG